MTGTRQLLCINIICFMKTKVLLLFIILVPATIFSQEDDTRKDKNVTIVKEYTPTISDAFKLNIEPKISDTVSVKPSFFKYYFLDKPIFVPFAVQSIQAANMVGEPLAWLHKNYLRVGFGSNILPMLEYHFNSLRSKEFQYGIYAKHLSFNNKIKLENDNKVPAGFSDNEIKLHGKRMLRDKNLGSELNFARNGFHYYGINPALDTIPDRNDMSQRYIKFHMNSYIESTKKDEGHIHYLANLGYGFFQEITGNFENQVNLNGEISNEFDGNNIGIDFNGNFFNQNIDGVSQNAYIITLAPWLSKIEKVWRVKAGLKAVAEAQVDSVLWHFYPNVIMQYNIIENIMIPYFGFNGNLILNNFSAIHEENPFAEPDLIGKNENNFISLFGGIKGAMTKTMFYDFGVSYNLIDNMHFFVNDTNDFLQNRFSIVDDNVELLSLHGEITWKKTQKWNILMHAEYNKYSMDKEEYPWQRPELTINLSSKYNLRDKILMNIDFFYLDKVFAKTFDTNGNTVARLITPTYDINLGLEYRYNNFFSGFLSFKNILGKYEIWNYYPTMGFHVMVGVTYSF